MEKDTNPKDAIGTAKWRQFTVVPMQVLWEVGVGMLEGTLKYGRHNYRGAGVRASVYVDAALGHIHQFWEGEDIDKDSGLSHVTKAICSLFVLRDAMMNEMWNDDRPPKARDMDKLRDELGKLVAENFERYAHKDPHHYTQAEDPAKYAMGTLGVEATVLERFLGSAEYDRMAKEEQSRRALRLKARSSEWLAADPVEPYDWSASEADFDDAEILQAATAGSFVLPEGIGQVSNGLAQNQVDALLRYRGPSPVAFDYTPREILELRKWAIKAGLITTDS